MAEPTAIGMVLATLVDRAGKPVARSEATGQLYASADGLTVVRPPRRDQLVSRLAGLALIASISVAVANLMVWKELTVLWVALALQLPYWFTLPARRRQVDPVELDAAGLEAARAAGRVAIAVPAAAIAGTTAPVSPRAGFRKPARFLLADGGLDVYLSDDAFRRVCRALGRE